MLLSNALARHVLAYLPRGNVFVRGMVASVPYVPPWITWFDELVVIICHLYFPWITASQFRIHYYFLHLHHFWGSFEKITKSLCETCLPAPYWYDKRSINVQFHLLKYYLFSRINISCCYHCWRHQHSAPCYTLKKMLHTFDGFDHTPSQRIIPHR